jgi:uncharacterized BrkB/YihY/UPF0761 family membrane protein
MYKAKRETVSAIVNGIGIIYLIIIVGIFIYLPLSEIIQSGNIGQFGELFPIKKVALAPLPILALSIILFFISAKLKNDRSWYSKKYDELSPGALLSILVFFVWVIMPIVGFTVETILQ